MVGPRREITISGRYVAVYDQSSPHKPAPVGKAQTFVWISNNNGTYASSEKTKRSQTELDISRNFLARQTTSLRLLHSAMFAHLKVVRTFLYFFLSFFVCFYAFGRRCLLEYISLKAGNFD